LIFLRHPRLYQCGIVSLLLGAVLACSHVKFRLQPPSEKKPPSGVYHTVRAGETLWRICKAYAVNVQDVAELNNIQDPSKIKAGDALFIPGAAKPKKIPAPAPAAKDTPEPEPRIVRQTGLFIWPVQGKVIQEYGITRNQKNDGISIQAPAGAPVCAAASGSVVFADFLKGYGTTIIINHDDNYATVYAQVRNPLVRRGQTVRKNDKIAEVADAQPPNQSQIHFQIRKNNEPRNPLFFLPR